MRALFWSCLGLALLSFGWAGGANAQEATDARLQRVDFEATVQSNVRMNHWLYLPPDYENQESWPLLVFLHGAGERGNDLEKVKVHGPPKMIAAGKDFPFVVVAPQCEGNGRWHADAVAALTRHVAQTLKIDPRRIYLTGLSMGGFGTWDTAAKHPDLYAAIAPICGGGNPEQVQRLKGIPAWVFHGARDEVVPLRRSEEMVKALEAVGGNVKLTVYPDAGHDSWTETYNNPELYDWLLSHDR
jgi:predicted peptidase